MSERFVKLPDTPFFVVKDPFSGRFSKAFFWAFSSDPKIDLSDLNIHVNLLTTYFRAFGLGKTPHEACADLLSNTSSPVFVTLLHPVVKRCISAIPMFWKCCSNQLPDVRLCHDNDCNADALDFVMERNLYHIHVICKNCLKRTYVKFQDKDFSFVETS